MAPLKIGKFAILAFVPLLAAVGCQRIPTSAPSPSLGTGTSTSVSSPGTTTAAPSLGVSTAPPSSGTSTPASPPDPIGSSSAPQSSPPVSTSPPAPTSAPPTSSAPTSSAPAPTPSGTCTTSAAKGSCGPYTYPQIEDSSQDPTVGQDVWAPISGWQQSLSAVGPGDWSATANMPAGNTAVVSFPNTGAGYGEQPVSKFKSITSSFSENMNATSKTSAWAAYDLWFNNWGNEVMIQHDFANNGACPFLATQSFGGSGGVPVQTWGLCKYGSELIWKLTTGSEQTGSVDILSMVTWLESHGYMPSASTITALSYGFEICSTGGQNETFHVNSFSISATT